VKSWKEGGYIMTLLEGKLDNTIEEVEGLYKDFSEKISTLESMQEEFDGMDTSHFRAEAEEIEFKMNDPGLINEIRDEIDQLKEKLNEDRRRRGEYFSKMNEYISQGFTGAEKLKSVMNEDISIIELEFNNFEKEVKMLKKYMESTGFDLNNEKKESRKAENKLEKEKKPKGGEQAEKEEIEGESGAFRCTNCGKRVPADSSECPECGASFEGEVYECPKCHTEVPEGTSVCPGCGAEFEV
jgi:RNA polymerase subunit RPABC4/transcription elongation factor Spt4/flagellar biosynthesis chaperone FliJ